MSVYKKQKDLIEEKEWDCLVVLDACRFDFFKDIYRDYFDGKLRKVISEGSQTSEWLRKTFRDRHPEVVYVSSNPYINSRKAVVGFDGSKHFGKVLDVWDWGWDKEMRTVLPEKMEMETRSYKAKHPNRRIISHFMQPHYPYLSLGPVKNESLQNVNNSKGRKINNSPSDYLEEVKNNLEQLSFDILGWKNTQRIKGFLNLSNQLSKPKYSEIVAKKYGKRELRLAYRENLKRALAEVAKLSKHLPGKVIVTSDHGELLGENGMYGHYRAFDHPLLKEVPWLKVD